MPPIHPWRRTKLVLLHAWRAFAVATRWLGSRQPVVLVGLLVVIAGTWGFIEVADEVREGTTMSFDEAILRAMRDPQNLSDPIGPRWVEDAFRDITALGGITVLLLLIAGTSGFLWLEGKRRTTVLIVLATLGGLAISQLLKGVFDRPRPELVPHLEITYTSSFPSGHAMVSATVYLTLGVLLTRVVHARRVKFYVMLLAVLLTGLVGASRVYLGVHYPTDVLAGWTAGLVWATLFWLASRRLARRGAIEPEE
jgi:undecaprenyl-diphosphatase